MRAIIESRNRTCENMKRRRKDGTDSNEAVTPPAIEAEKGLM